MSSLAPTLQAFFTDRLIRERAVSPNTIAAYRDTIRLLLVYARALVGELGAGMARPDHAG
jgi:integrase/recombinase XerD